MKRRLCILMTAAVLAAMPGFGYGADKKAPPPAPVASAPAIDPAVSKALEALPADGLANGVKALEAFGALGQKGIDEAVKALEPQGNPLEARAEFALHGLATQAGREGGAAERAALAKALSPHLGGTAPARVKVFLIEQLQYAGAREALADVARCLTEKDVTSAAARALVVFGGGESKSPKGQPAAAASADACAALREALPKLAGPDRRPVIQALGTLRDVQAAGAIRKLADDPDLDTRLAAFGALGSIGDASATDLLLKAAADDNAYNAARGLDAALTLAARLAEARNAAGAETIYQHFWAMMDKGHRHARCAALEGLAALNGDKALPLVMEAVDGDEPQLRAVAVRLGGTLPGEKVTAAWVGRLEKASARTQADIVRLLARRGDVAALPAVERLLTSKDTPVQQAAIAATAALGQAKAVGQLAPLVGTDALRGTVQASLTAIPGTEVTAAIAGLLADAPSAIRAGLLPVLTVRGAKAHQAQILACLSDKEANARLAALSALEALADEGAVATLLPRALKSDSDGERGQAEKALIAVLRRMADAEARAKPVIAAIGTAKAEDRVIVLRVLSQIGGKPALRALEGLTQDTGTEVQDAAIRALANSATDPDAMPTLLALAKNGPKPAHQILALRGYIRLIALAELSADEKLKLYADTMILAKRPDERKAVLSGVGSVYTPKALAFAGESLDDDAVREEAALAALQIAQKIMGKEGKDARPVVEKVADISKNPNTVKQAKGLLAKYPAKG